MANSLHKSMPRLTASVLSLIEKRLVIVGQEALEVKDGQTTRVLGNYRRCHIMSIVQGEMPDIALANERYRQSALALGRASQTLERMTSPAAAIIASKIRDRLELMAREAHSDKDSRMIQALSKYCDTSASNTATSRGNQVDSLTYKEPKQAPTQSARVSASPLERGSVASSNTNRPNTKKRDTIPNTSALLNVASHRLNEAKRFDIQDTKSNERSSGQKFARQIQAQSGSMKSPDTSHASHPARIRKGASPNASVDPSGLTAVAETPGPKHTPSSKSGPSQIDELSELSLLEELFPEVNPSSPSKPKEKRDHYPKLDLPESRGLVRQELVDRPQTRREQITESFQNSGENITVLQLEHCSIELIEADFRRLIPKGRHIETWNRDGQFYKIFPGRDPISLERLPFYYLLFETLESARAYQNNAARLHKLAALHRPSSILSAMPAPRGFLEDGEDIDAVTSSYLLKPTEHVLSLRTIMQPYHPALRALVEQGGYTPIVPDVDDGGNRIHKVLMYIEGYEPNSSDLFKIFSHDAYHRGVPLGIRNESSTSIHRLRDRINLKTRMHPISTSNPRAYSHWDHDLPASPDANKMKLEFEDANISVSMKGDGDDSADDAKRLNQIVMNRVYNRWLIEFEDGDEARRFATVWHRRVLPELVKGDRTWKDYEEVRMCNCEVLW
ncbi:hypothetical protein GQ44DRAFT_697171 [Phaeosphaeriaceae sp. PMI808]|nr:hypothetical protein GQ44DRAFT_697171 [Phaeosphaeriaceae sp. PMI808]